MGIPGHLVNVALACLALALVSADSTAASSGNVGTRSASEPQQCADAVASNDPGTSDAAMTEFADDPAAHALYDKMIEAMWAAKTLSWQSDYRWESQGNELGHPTYQIWMKKPLYARLEASTDGQLRGVLVLDGEHFWTYWPHGRPRYDFEDEVTWEMTSTSRYSKDAPGSIAHMTDKLGAGLAMPVIQPSYFHGGGSSLDEHIDWVRSMGSAEKVGNEECDLIEVSVMDHQRSRYLWLSKRDHLPRKLKEIVRLEHDTIIEETWSRVEVDQPISDDLFKWSPPRDWKEWRLPTFEEGLLEAGTQAPDFDLVGADGSRIRLADYRGKMVWLFVWRVGCPPCREEMPKLEKVQAQYRDRGLVVIGVNASDHTQIAAAFLGELGITFPNALGASEAACKTVFSDYQTLKGMSAVPMNCIIDRDGKVADSFYGYDEERGIATLHRLGLK